MLFFLMIYNLISQNTYYMYFLNAYFCSHLEFFFPLALLYCSNVVIFPTKRLRVKNHNS